MMLQQSNVSQEQINQQVQKAVKEAQVAAEQAAKAAADGHARVIQVPSPVIVGTPTTAPAFDRDMPPRVKEVSVAFMVTMAFVIVGFPIARAIGRRIDRPSTKPQQLPPEVRQELQQLSASVEAIAIEVERISEGQRFTTKLLTEKQASIPAQS